MVTPHLPMAGRFFIRFGMYMFDDAQTVVEEMLQPSN